MLTVIVFCLQVVKRSVVNALDSGGVKRKAMADLLKALHDREVVSGDQMQNGFDRLVQLLPDLTLDSPNAKTIVEEFTIQAVSDGILHKKNIGGSVTDYGVGSLRASATPPAAPEVTAE
jgi:hypothetical protein